VQVFYFSLVLLELCFQLFLVGLFNCFEFIFTNSQLFNEEVLVFY
jgi:hypothetical protein